VTCVMCDDILVTAGPKALERDGRLAVVRDVPVLVCDSCGEVYLDASVTRQLAVVFRRLLDGSVDQVVGHDASSLAWRRPGRRLATPEEGQHPHCPGRQRS